jgi:hypothetical protein
VPTVDLVDETFVVVDRAELAAVVADPERWRLWWPDLEVTVFMDRGLDGIRWSARGRWVGSLEIWLEPHGDGVLVHHYQRLDPVDPRTGHPRAEPTDVAGWRRAARERDRRARAWKRHAWALKDETESGRRAGEPRSGEPRPSDSGAGSPASTNTPSSPGRSGTAPTPVRDNGSAAAPAAAVAPALGRPPDRSAPTLEPDPPPQRAWGPGPPR